MLVLCLECRQKISDQAKSCPHCGCPASYLDNEPPTLFGAFLTGIGGRIMGCFGLLCLAGSMIGFIAGGDGATFWLVVGIALMIGGAYAKYVSTHSVRNTR